MMNHILLQKFNQSIIIYLNSQLGCSTIGGLQVFALFILLFLGLRIIITDPITSENIKVRRTHQKNPKDFEEL